MSSGFVVTPPLCPFAGAGFVNLNMSTIAPVISIIMKVTKGRCRVAGSVASFGEKKNSNNALRGQEMSRAIRGNPWREKRAVRPNSEQEISASAPRF